MSDLISRQAAIEYCYALINAENPSDEWNYGQERINQTEVILHHIESMPSAQPEQKVGKWIGGELGYCTCCGHKGCASDIWNACEKLYCPNCGAKMEE